MGVRLTLEPLCTCAPSAAAHALLTLGPYPPCVASLLLQAALPNPLSPPLLDIGVSPPCNAHSRPFPPCSRSRQTRPGPNSPALRSSRQDFQVGVESCRSTAKPSDPDWCFLDTLTYPCLLCLSFFFFVCYLKRCRVVAFGLGWSQAKNAGKKSRARGGCLCVCARCCRPRFEPKCWLTRGKASTARRTAGPQPHPAHAHLPLR